MTNEEPENLAGQHAAPLVALRTRRAEFLAEMERLLPWRHWEELIEPHYPKRGKGRPPYPLRPLLRLYLVRQWFALSDRAAQEAATDSVAVRNFIGLGLAWVQGAPDETTMHNFRKLLDRRGLAGEIASGAAVCLVRNGWRIRPGEIAEAGIVACSIAGPS